MFFRIVSVHFSVVFFLLLIVFACSKLFYWMFCVVLTSFQFSDVEFGCSALFYVVFGGL